MCTIVQGAKNTKKKASEDRTRKTEINKLTDCFRIIEYFLTFFIIIEELMRTTYV